VPRVLIVAAKSGYQTRELEQAARELGYESVLATDRCHVLDDPWGDQAVALKFDQPEAAAKAISTSNLSRFDGIVAVGDRPAYVAAVLAEALGLRFSPAHAVAACKNKFLARQRFAQHGLLVPHYERLPLGEDPRDAAARWAYPCVMKPTGLSASRGVIRVDDPVQFQAAFERIKALLESPEIRQQRDPANNFIQVEQYIPGREFALEGLLSKGEFQPVALFDKPDPLEGPFFEETIYVTPSRLPREQQDQIVETTRRAIAALGLTDGPIHAEMRLNQRGVWILEVANRPIGGLCARALKLEGNRRYEQVILQHACGSDVPDVRQKPGGSGVLMIPIRKGGIYLGVTGEEDARKVPGVTDVVITATEGQEIRPLPEGSSYLGFIFSHSSTPDEAEQALRDAELRLFFQTQTVLPVVR
jgi:biotin carboxylase